MANKEYVPLRDTVPEEHLPIMQSLMDSYEKKTKEKIHFSSNKILYFDPDIPGFFFFQPVEDNVLQVYETNFTNNYKLGWEAINDTAKKYGCTCVRTVTKHNPKAFAKLLGWKLDGYIFYKEVQ